MVDASDVDYFITNPLQALSIYPRPKTTRSVTQTVAHYRLHLILLFDISLPVQSQTTLYSEVNRPVGQFLF